MYEQSKLDAQQKKRSHPFAWRGQFTPELIEYFLKTHYQPGMLVADPFSGSGTILYEALRLEANAVSCELNPSAYAMSKFFELGQRTLAQRQQLCLGLSHGVPFTKKQGIQPVYQSEEMDYRKAYGGLIEFAQGAIDSVSQEHELILLLNILFKMEGHKKLNIGQSWNKAYLEISDFLYSLPENHSSVFAHFSDARKLHHHQAGSVDLIITSPPYINVFNYHQNHRIIMELLHLDILKVAHSEFGSNRKHRGNRFLTVIQYCLDMAQTLQSMGKAMKRQGELVMIVGRESNVQKTPFYNGNIIQDLATKTELFHLKNRSERVFLNKFGKSIVEDILLFQPACLHQEIEESARTIAVRHLKTALVRVPQDARELLKQAIESIDRVRPSPIFPNTLLS